MKHELIELPYAKNALEPVMSEETLDFHYSKHHQAYVTKLNELQAGTEFENMNLEEIIKKSSGGIFNNAAQIWNHNLFWTSFTDAQTSESSLNSPQDTSLNSPQDTSLNSPQDTSLNSPQDTSLNSLPKGEMKLQKLQDLVDKSFGSLENMKSEFKAESLGRFGSGWVWLVQKGETLEIYSTPNAENPLTEGGTALLGCDVWEHSYYIDYRNDRGAFIDNFWKIIDWNVIEGRMV